MRIEVHPGDNWCLGERIKFKGCGSLEVENKEVIDAKERQWRFKGEKVSNWKKEAFMDENLNIGIGREMEKIK